MTEPARRPTRSLLWRFIFVAAAIGISQLLLTFYGTHAVELLCAIPSSIDDGTGLDLRVTRVKDHKLIVRVEQHDRMKDSHTVVVHTKLPRGRYHVDAWLLNAQHTALTADFDYAGEDAVEVQLAKR